MENQAIVFAGITISEPATCFTDIILSVLCFILYQRIHANFNKDHFINSWKYFFLFMSISTGIGVIAHGLTSYFTPSAFNYLWMTMNMNVALASFYCMKATIKFVAANEKLRKRINFINIIVLSVFILLTVFLNNFEIVKIYIAITVTSTFVVHLVGYVKDKADAASGYIMLGMLISFLTIIIHSEQLSFTYWFDYKAISHVIMMMSLLLVYRGVRTFNYNLGPETT